MSFQEFFIQQVKDHEDKVVKQVLREYLKREPTVEDASRTQMFFENNRTEYWFLAYDNIPLGRIDRVMDWQNNSYNIKFTPNH